MEDDWDIAQPDRQESLDYSLTHNLKNLMKPKKAIRFSNILN